MPKYIIEREIPGAGNLTKEQIHQMSVASCAAITQLGPAIQWKHSYIAGDKIYCVYIAPDKAIVLEHAKLGGFPANLITEVSTIADAVNAE